MHEASTPPCKAGRFYHPGNFLESLGVARNQNQLQMRKFIGDLSEGLQADAFLGILGAPAEPDGRAAIAKSEWTGPSEHFGMRTVVVGSIELDVPNDLDFRRIVTQLDEPLADRVALRGDPIDFAHDPPDNRGDAAVAFKGFLAKPTVDDGYRDPALRGDRDPIGPEFQFGQDQQIRFDAIEGPADCPGKIHGSIRNGVCMVELLGQFVARVSRGGNDQFGRWQIPDRPLDKRPDDLQFTDTNGMEPNRVSLVRSECFGRLR